MQTTLAVNTTFGAQNPNRTYDVYIYDSNVNGVAAYNHVILVRSGALKNGNQKAVDLAVGDFKEIKLTGADGLIGARAGQTAGFYTKLITLDHQRRCDHGLQALLHLGRACDREMRHGGL